MTITSRDTFEAIATQALARQDLGPTPEPHEVLQRLWVVEGYLRDMGAIDRLAVARRDIEDAAADMRASLEVYAAELARLAREGAAPPSRSPSDMDNRAPMVGAGRGGPPRGGHHGRQGPAAFPLDHRGGAALLSPGGVASPRWSPSPYPYRVLHDAHRSRKASHGAGSETVDQPGASAGGQTEATHATRPAAPSAPVAAGQGEELAGASATTAPQGGPETAAPREPGPLSTLARYLLLAVAGALLLSGCVATCDVAAQLATFRACVRGSGNHWRWCQRVSADLHCPGGGASGVPR